MHTTYNMQSYIFFFKGASKIQNEWQKKANDYALLRPRDYFRVFVVE